MFSAEQLQKLVTENLPPPGKPGEHVVIGTIDQHGAKVMATFAFENGWQLQAAVQHEWSGEHRTGATILMRW